MGPSPRASFAAATTLCTVRRVHLKRCGAAAEFFDLADDGVGCVTAFAIGECDIGAGFGEAESDGATDAAAATSHDGIPSCQ